MCPHAFVAVDIGMIHDERVHERRSLRSVVGIEILPAERHRGTGDRGLQASSIPQTGTSTVVPKLERVELLDLIDREIERQLLRELPEGIVVRPTDLLGKSPEAARDFAVLVVLDPRSDGYGAALWMDRNVDRVSLLQLELFYDLRRKGNGERASDLDDLSFHKN